MARAETPARFEATAPSLRLAHSSTLCKWLTTIARCWIKLVRCRVKSRKSRCGKGGMKLPRSRPWRRRSARSCCNCVGSGSRYIPIRHTGWDEQPSQLDHLC